MAIRLLNLDELYHQHPGEILPVREKLTKKSLVQKYIADMFLSEYNVSFRASCGCGKLQGNFYEGIECPNCKEKASCNLSHEMSYRVWIRMPVFAPPVLNPRAYSILDQQLGKYNNESLLRQLLGNGEKELPPEIAEWYSPGWRNFYEQFDMLFDFILNKWKIFQRSSNRKRAQRLREFIQENRDGMFATLLPVLNSSLHLITHSGELKHVDQTADHIIQCIVDISIAQHRWDTMIKDEKFVNKTMDVIYQSYLAYANSIVDVKLVNKEKPKKGFVRRQMVGSRCHFSCRAVVIPITEPHMGDEVHMPWRISVECMKLEIMNVLINRKGMDLYDAQVKVMDAVQQYDPEIHDILRTLIYECPYKGLPILLNRNPSLILGAIQLFYVTKILPDDNVIGLSPLTINAPNGDFDGDQFNGVFIKEMDAVKAYENIHPMQTMTSEHEPGIDDTVSLIDQSETVLQAWLMDDRKK